VVQRYRFEEDAHRSVLRGVGQARAQHWRGVAGTRLFVRHVLPNAVGPVINVPARQKFLRSDNSEAGHITDLVQRLAHEHPDKTVFCLDPIFCPCSTMYRVHPAYLCWVLEELAEGRVVNRIHVDGETAHWARIALERMLQVR